MNLATKASDPYVPENRWIASLSNGQTIFQDSTPGIESAWSRLRAYVEANNLHVTNLRLQAYGQHVQLLPFKADDGSRQLNGYWFANRLSRIFGLPGLDAESKEIGIGYLAIGRKIRITWVREDGIICNEERDWKSSNDPSLIINHGDIPYPEDDDL